MLKIDEVSNPSSCLNKAADDEPVFVLRANDPIAPAVVRYWARQYLGLKRQSGGSATPEQRRKAEEAEDLAKRMMLWKQSQVEAGRGDWS